MRQRYICWNGAVPTTGVQTPVTLTNAQKTQLQITAPSTGQLEVIAWGCTMNGSALAAGVQVELLTTAAVAGTGMTAVTPTLYGDPNAPASNATAGFTPSAEGTIATVRMLDSEYVQDLAGYSYQFPLGERPIIAVSQVLRVRTNTPASVTPGFLCYVIWAE
jgi:hypothetical protein